MRKAAAVILVLALMGAAFTGGILVGRHSVSGDVSIHISPEQNVYAENWAEIDGVILDAYNCININLATVEDLMTVPGISADLAVSIIMYREENGLFFAVDELRNVPGISDKTYIKISQYFTTKD